MTAHHQKDHIRLNRAEMSDGPCGVRNAYWPGKAARKASHE
jgi:hypothetical protein